MKLGIKVASGFPTQITAAWLPQDLMGWERHLSHLMYVPKYFCGNRSSKNMQTKIVLNAFLMA
jgi:hypothetical protein